MSALDACSPLVSIALCTYNGERFLAQQLDSILAQDYRRLEVVVVDDASSDLTWAVLENYARRDPRIRAFRNGHNLGHVKNFESALRRCTGDYVALSDQDDIWLPTKLSRLLSVIDKHSAAYCDSLYVDEMGNSRGERLSDRRRCYSGRDPSVFAFANCASGHAMIVRSSVLEHALPLPDIEAHDWWLAFAAASLDGIVYLHDPLVSFRRHSLATSWVGRENAGSTKRGELAEFERYARHLAALRTLAGPHQNYFQALYDAWMSRRDRRRSWLLAWLLLRKSRTLYFIRGHSIVGRLRRIEKLSRGFGGRAHLPFSKA